MRHAEARDFCQVPHSLAVGARSEASSVEELEVGLDTLAGHGWHNKQNITVHGVVWNPSSW